MDFGNNHALHGALAGVAVYVLTRKPLPSIAVGGAAYLYMSKYGHALPGATVPGTTTPAAPMNDDPISPALPALIATNGAAGWWAAPPGWTGSLQQWRDTAHLLPPGSYS